MKSVCVFCSSSDQLSPFFFEEVGKLGRVLAENKYKIIYGGANCGLMGRLADEALKTGGLVQGIMPNIFEKSVTHNGLSELKTVADMSERKQHMLDQSDAFIVFPGGIGTLDEAIEMICYKQINTHSKPILFVNYLNFWDPFFEMLDLFKDQHMISGPLSDYYHVVDTSEEVVGYLSQNL